METNNKDTIETECMRTAIEFQDEPETSKKGTSNNLFLMSTDQEEDQEMSDGIMIISAIGDGTVVESLRTKSELAQAETKSPSTVPQEISAAMASDHGEQQCVLKSNENICTLGDVKGTKAVETILTVPPAAKDNPENLDQKIETKGGDISKDFLKEVSENVINTKEHVEQQITAPPENSEQNQGGGGTESEETSSVVMEEQIAPPSESTEQNKGEQGTKSEKTSYVATEGQIAPPPESSEQNQGRQGNESEKTSSVAMEEQITPPPESSEQNQGGQGNEGEETSSVAMEELCYEHERHIEYNFAITPQQVTGAWQDFNECPSCFLKGCKWSPDGSCIVTASDDNMLRIFNLPAELFTGTPVEGLSEMLSVLKIVEGETIYDYAWYPYMSSLDPDTCCLLSSSRDHPVHMWDAFNGSLRCSYRSYDHMDEIVSPNCVTFNLDGSEIYCGFNNMVRVFNTARPGREYQNRPTLVKKYGQHGIISSITFCPDLSGLYALGSYSKTVGVYSNRGELLYLLQGQTGGVTQVMFSQDGTKLYSGGRKDEEILCWDIRNPGKVVYRLLRSVTTNQRMHMDIDRSGRYVISGSSNGSVSVWDTCVSPLSDVSETLIPTLPPVMNYAAHGDCVNGVSFHPSLPLLATASGQRKFPTPGGSDSSDEESCDKDPDLQTDNSLRIWALCINSTS